MTGLIRLVSSAAPNSSSMTRLPTNTPWRLAPLTMIGAGLGIALRTRQETDQGNMSRVANRAHRPSQRAGTADFNYTADPAAVSCLENLLLPFRCPAVIDTGVHPQLPRPLELFVARGRHDDPGARRLRNLRREHRHPTAAKHQDRLSRLGRRNPNDRVPSGHTCASQRRTLFERQGSRQECGIVLVNTTYSDSTPSTGLPNATSGPGGGPSTHPRKKVEATRSPP